MNEGEENLEEEVRTLQELYCPGQYLVTRVVSVEPGEKMTKGELSVCVCGGKWGIK